MRSELKDIFFKINSKIGIFSESNQLLRGILYFESTKCNIILPWFYNFTNSIYSRQMYRFGQALSNEKVTDLFRMT